MENQREERRSTSSSSSDMPKENNVKSVPNSVESTPVKESKKSIYWCNIIFVIVVAITIILLLIVAIYYVVVSPRISKDLTSVPTTGYLFMAHLNNLTKTKQCEKIESDDFDQLLEIVKSSKKNGTQAWVLDCSEWFTSDGIIESVRKNLENFLVEANKHGVSMGISIEKQQLNHVNFINYIKRIPLLSYYHSISDADPNSIQKIKEFGKNINDNIKYFIPKTNNLIFRSDNYKIIESIYKEVGSGIDAIVMSVHSLQNEFRYPQPPVSMIFFPMAVGPSTMVVNFDLNDERMLLSRSIFLSNASAFSNGYGLGLAGNEDYMTEISNANKETIEFLEYLRDFVKVKEKTRLWNKVYRTIKIYTISESPNRALAYSFEILKENSDDFTHLILLQNIAEDDSITNTYSLESLAIPSNSKAQVLICFPKSYSLKNMPVIKINKIELPKKGSIVVAIYNEEKAKTLKNVLESWPKKP